MRVTQYEKQVLLQAIKQVDTEAKVYLFGSRVDDAKKGGDIDILIHSQALNKQALRKIKWQIMEQLGEQKIDVVISRELKEAFVRLIMPTAVELEL